MRLALETQVIRVINFFWMVGMEDSNIEIYGDNFQFLSIHLSRIATERDVRGAYVLLISHTSIIDSGIHNKIQNIRGKKLLTFPIQMDLVCLKFPSFSAYQAHTGYQGCGELF